MKIVVVSCTASDASTFPTTPLGRSLDRLEKVFKFDREIFLENKSGLSERYNQAIEKYKDSHDVAVMVHDDVLLTDAMMDEKLERGFLAYDILGVAGSSKFALDEPVVWHNSPKESWSGAVEHPMTDKKEDSGVFYYTLFGATPKQCAVVDGVFMAVNLKRLGGVRFQEEFTFHFYDLAFCMEAYHGGLKIGTSNIHLTHLSHGDYRNSGWQELQEKFVKKYRKH